MKLGPEPAPGVRRPPVPLLVLLAASLAMCALTMGHARDYVRAWNRHRRGKPPAEQIATLGRRPGWPTAIVPWFDPTFLEFVEDLRDTVPPDARILVEPDPSEIHDESGRGRWFLYLNYAAYPLRLYVRKPAAAGGTLVDYTKWLVHHVKGKDVSALLDEQIAIEEREIDYKLVLAITRDFDRSAVRLYRRDGRDWKRVRIGRAAGPGDAGGDGDAAPAGSPGGEDVR